MASEVKSSALALEARIGLRGPGLDSRAEKYLQYFEAGHNICLLGHGKDRRQLRFNLHVQCSAYIGLHCVDIGGENVNFNVGPYAFGIDF